MRCIKGTPFAMRGMLRACKVVSDVHVNRSPWKPLFEAPFELT
jgi:hypothetical protein